MLLWLDDTRPAPPGWTWAKTVREAVAIMRRYPVQYASLDYDLGPFEPKGSEIVKWMAMTGIWPAYRPGIHSRNLSGVIEIAKAIISLGPYA